MSIVTRRIAVLVPFLVAIAATAGAQTPAPPPPGWIGSAGAGLALTQGNSDTSTVNIGYVELLDTLKNKPPSAAVKKNDVAVLVSFVYKID